MEHENKSRIGCKWIINEDEQLIQEVKDKKSYEEIALNHKRTLNGIILRIIDKIIYNEYKNENKTIDELSLIYNIDKETLQSGINKFEINNSIKKNREDINNNENFIKKIEKKLEDIDKKLDTILFIIS